MSKLRITGLVRYADRLRRELAQPVTMERKTQLQRELAHLVRQVDQMVAEHGTRVAALPSPTRRAYDFLVRLDMNAMPTAAPPVPSQLTARPSGSVRLVQLKAHWEQMLRNLALCPNGDETARLFESIRSTSENIEGYLRQQGIQSSELTAQTRAIRAWLALFAQRPQFDRYVVAVAEARATFAAAIQSSSRFRPPALVEFRPIPGLYRVRGYADGTQVVLPTPMICFSAEQLRQTGDVALNRGSKEPVATALASEECQGIQAELEILAGLEEQVRGIQRDLALSFDRVNGRYFSGGLERPRLTWSRTFTGRKFGHYDPIRDTVMISCTLDQSTVPEPALDFVMYHELLHKQLGVDWRNGRAAAHTPEFRAAERRFERYADAESLLKKLAIDIQPQVSGRNC